ncbi:MAG: YigZ family protein [Oscillospiraceae bacterium]|nr:YigZ family protein [Oscillospiraceae bacterium]
MGYRTVSGISTGEYEDRRSQFIGQLCHADTEEEALAFIAKVRSENRKARHNVYAYILRDGNISRYTDDGEPSGTAGVPVLEILRHEGLVDVCIVVTRYFGGILLGTGGLVRAYTQAAKLAVESAAVMDMQQCSEMDITCDYTYYGILQGVFTEYAVKTVSSDFADAVRLVLLCPEERAADFTAAVTETTNGRVTATVKRSVYADMNS